MDIRQEFDNWAMNIEAGKHAYFSKNSVLMYDSCVTIKQYLDICTEFMKDLPDDSIENLQLMQEFSDELEPMSHILLEALYYELMNSITPLVMGRKWRIIEDNE